MNWLIEEALNRHGEFMGANIGLFRLVFALSIMIKFFIETQRGHLYYFNNNKYLSILYEFRNPGGRWLTQGIWRTLYMLKLPAAGLLFLGILCKFSLLILIASFFVELKVYFKYHSNFMLLLCIGLLWSTSINQSVSLSTLLASDSWSIFVASSLQTTECLIAPCWVMVTLFAMYWFTALHKCNSAFLSGRIVAITLYTLNLERPLRKFIDFKLPNILVRCFITETGEPKELLSYLMKLVVLLEFLIPFGLLFRATVEYSIIVGITLHIGFLLLLPTTLLDFSLATISTYIVFVGPDKLSRVLDF